MPSSGRMVVEVMAGSKANSERATEAVACLQEGGNLRVVRWHKDDRGGARCVELAAGAGGGGGGGNGSSNGGGGGGGRRQDGGGSGVDESMGTTITEGMFGAASGYVAEYLHARGEQIPYRRTITPPYEPTTAPTLHFSKWF